MFERDEMSLGGIKSPSHGTKVSASSVEDDASSEYFCMTLESFLKSSRLSGKHFYTWKTRPEVEA
jgi:hypothetical protein